MQNRKLPDLTGEFSRYTAPLVLRRLEKKSPKSNDAEADQYSAAVLFVDIIGYSALAERFAQQEYEGVEELAELLNNCLALLVRVINEHGGEITKFAGDALVAIWPVPQSMSRVGSAARQALAAMVLQATQCALAIQKEGTNLSPGKPGESILRIGIAAGDIYAVHLGGVLGRWEFLLSGEPMVQMSQAKDMAGPGEVVLDPSAWSLVSDVCSASTGRNSFATVNAVMAKTSSVEKTLPTYRVLNTDDIKSYIPAAITTRIESGFGDWLSEIRYLTILFVKLPGYGTSIAHPYATTIPEAQAVMRAMQDALYKFEGSINKFNVDDKGITLVAALGLPPLAHRDDVSRGVQAGLELEKALNALDRPCSIGIGTGWVFCGPVGSDLRREYTVAGNSVNRASSLMQVAETMRIDRGLTSFILCDEVSYDSIARTAGDGKRKSDQFIFERIAGIMLKGRKTAVAAYRPYRTKKIRRSVSRRYGVRTSFVGRRIEKQALKTHIQELSQSDSFMRILLIEGEEGVGKTALLAEILRDATSYDVGILMGAGEEGEQSRPYFAWRAIFTRIFDIDLRFDDAGNQRRKVMRSLPALPGEKGYPALALKLTPLLNPVLGLDFAENRVTNSMSPEVRNQSTRLFLVRLLQHSIYDSRRQRSRSHIIVLDNGQWLDEDSCRLTLAVAQAIRPVLIVLASRPLRRDALGRPPSSVFAGFLKDTNLERATLRLLPPDEMARVYADLVEPYALSAEFAEALWGMAGGNPDIAGHLVHHWREQGLLGSMVQGGDPFDVSIINGSDAIPESVRKTIVGRIDRLGNEQQMVVKAAAGFSTSFSSDALAAVVMEMTGDLDLEAIVPSLVELGIFQIIQGSDQTIYRFSYSLIREVVRELMPQSQRRLIYAAALRAS